MPACSPHRRIIRTSGLTVALVVLMTTAAAAGGFEKTFRFDSDDLEVVNMIGAVEVVAAAGDDFEVTVHVRGSDADDELIRLTEEQGRTGRLAVGFPLDKHQRYVYPELGGSKSTIHFRDGDSEDSSWLRKIFAAMTGRKITVAGRGRGLEAWADLTIAVPEGAGLRLRHGVGEVRAHGVRGDLDLDTHTGAIAVDDLVGDLRADTGSGAVAASGVKGKVLIDTGSGSARAVGVRGNVDIDTGSGAVEVEDVEGEKVHVDTGSGGVSAMGVVCAHLLIDTGSGGVRARGVAADRAEIDTGSGSVKVAFVRMGEGRFVVDTGSGSIEVELPADASARISADTGSGGIEADVPGAKVEHKERGELRLLVGDGAARMVLDAGSGSITIRGR